MQHKQCFKCKAEKPRSEFYAHRMMADGLLGKCKECTKADVKKHRQENHARICEYDRVRSRRPERRRSEREYLRRARERDPRKAKARAMVARHVRSGDLVPTPCVHCGEARVQAHHRDYDKPLDVVWCCFTCHREIEHGHKTSIPLDDMMSPHRIAKRTQ